MVKADKFDILNNDNSSAFCIENPYINIRLLPLILKDLDIKYFSANNATINLLFDKDSKLKLGQYLLDTQIKSPLKLKHASIDIDGYNINLDDKIQNKKIFLNGKYLTVNNFTADKHVNFSTIANLTTGKKKASLNADIDLKLPINKISDDQLDISANIVNLDLSDFSIYAKALSKNKIKSISGLINFTAKTNVKPDNHKQIKTNLYINDIGIFKDDITTSIYHKGKLTIKTDINTIKNGIDINEMKISGDGIKAFTTGQITKLNSKLPHLDLKVTINKSKAEKIISLLPGDEKLCPDINLLLLKKTGFWGDVAGNLEIKGKQIFLI